MATFITPPFRVIHYLGLKLLPSHQPPVAHTELASVAAAQPVYCVVTGRRQKRDHPAWHESGSGNLGRCLVATFGSSGLTHAASPT
jgi:hypothetical protein